MANATYKSSDDPVPQDNTPDPGQPSGVIWFAGTLLGGVALATPFAEPLLHHVRLADCNPRVELCRMADLTSLPDDRERHHRSGVPIGNGFVVVATTSSTNNTTLLSTTTIGNLTDTGS